MTQGGMTVRLEDERSARSVDEMIERLRGEMQRLKAVIEAYSQICVAYRIGRPPRDSALEIVREYSEAAKAGGEV